MPLISLFCWGLAVWLVIKQFKWSWKLSLSLSIVVKLRFLFCFFPFSFFAINRTASNVCRSTAGFSLLQQLCSEWDWEGTSGESRKSPTDTADERRERCVCARTLSCVMNSKGKRHYSTAHGQKDTIPSLHTISNKRSYSKKYQKIISGCTLGPLSQCYICTHTHTHTHTHTDRRWPQLMYLRARRQD